MGFRFPLATVLRVRDSIQKREERVLQRIQLDMARVSRNIEELNDAVAQSHRAREAELQQPVPAGQLQAMLQATQASIDARESLVEKLQLLRQQRDAQMKVYQAAHQNHEALIDMRDRQLLEYEQQQARAQQKFLDDIFMARRHRT
jgi:flagellar FliJ protein